MAQDEPADIGRIILAAMASLPHRVTRTTLAQLLAGIPGCYLTRYAAEFDGILASHSLKSLRAQMDALIERGLLEAHLEDEYRRLSITPDGLAALRGSQTIRQNPRCRPSSATPAPVPPAHISAAAMTNQPLSADDGDRLEQLRAWRHTEARRSGQAAFAILHDSTLKAIAQANPATVAALSAIPGIGPRTVELYARHILRVLHGDQEEF